MPRNKIADLRNHLFETLERLKDEDHPMDLERAKTIALVSQTIINSATVEVKFLHATGTRDHAAFFDEKPERPALEGRVTPIAPAKAG